MNEFIPFFMMAAAVICTFVYLTWFDLALLFYLFVRKAYLRRKLSVAVLGAVLAACLGASGFFGDLDTLTTIMDGQSGFEICFFLLVCAFPICVWTRSILRLTKNKRDRYSWGEVVVLTPAAIGASALLTLGVMALSGSSF